MLLFGTAVSSSKEYLSKFLKVTRPLANLKQAKQSFANSKA
jgi:hypothetical protein